MTDTYRILTEDGYSAERYATKAEAEHARRLRYGIRALAHPVVRFPSHLVTRNRTGEQPK